MKVLLVIVMCVGDRHSSRAAGAVGLIGDDVPESGSSINQRYKVHIWKTIAWFGGGI